MLSFQNIKRKLVIAAISIVASFATLYAVSGVSPVQAAVAGEVKEYVGVLEVNSNAAYTHKVGNIDLILNSSYDKYLGQSVKVDVQYYNSVEFTVLSVTPVYDYTYLPSYYYNYGRVRKYQGVLEKNDDESYTHKVDGLDLILNDSVADYVGKEVVVTVQYTDGWNFNVISVVPVEPIVADADADSDSDSEDTETEEEDADAEDKDSKEEDSDKEDSSEESSDWDTRVAEYTGVLYWNADSRYTHRLGTMDLILSSYYNRYVGSTVTVKVQYTDGWNFTVLSVTPAYPAYNYSYSYTGHKYGDVVEYTGVFEYNDNPVYTHQVGNVDLILNSSYNTYVGQNVRVTVQYYDAYHFTVLSVELI
ncbi:hypothetical protein JW887_00455 [Candidatus Dojkabacteria bacterium]|nr:hypothetical protein [Candidatus Dojkabacteria bacterium]